MNTSDVPGALGAGTAPLPGALAAHPGERPGALSDPPHELRAGLGQVTRAGGGPGLTPLLSPAPFPAAALGSGPGIAAFAIAPPAGPTLPDDPWAMAMAIARMANELGLVSPPVAAAPGVPSATSGAVPSTAGVSAPAVPATAAAPAALGPFGPPSFDALPSLDALDLAPASPFADVLRFPMLDGPVTAGAPPATGAPPSSSHAGPSPFDPAPYYLPGPAGESPEPAGPRVETYEHRPVQEELVRSLGGSIFDPYAVRRDFPILEERIHGKRLVWLDNAATTQKPRAVIERISHFYEHENSNVHRAAHTLAARATDAYESARETVRRFLGASSSEDIVFVRGATEGINLVAQSWGRRHVGPGDEIVITWLEHHANIVPWQQLCADRGARLRVAPVDDRGDVILEEYERLLGPRTRLVAFPQVSNALGTVTPAREMVEMAHRHGARVLVDGAQAVSHLRVDVQQLDCDFYVFSGHKVFAPTGIGVVYGKRDVLASMPPWQGGGNMIQDVTFERTVYQAPPWRFEAGTGSIADAAGLGAALDYLTGLGLENVTRHEHELLEYATECLGRVPGLRIVGTAPNKAGVVSFVLDGQRTEDVGSALDADGIAVRSGHHCAQPILRRYGLESTVRASLAPYNVREDVDALVTALHRLQAGRG